MRNRLFKVYAILISLGLILFAFVVHKKAFMGKNQSVLQNAENDGMTAPAGGPSAATDTASGAVAAAPAAAPPAPAAPAAPAAAAPAPVAAVVETPPAPSATPTPAPTAAMGEPAKGGVGDALKKLRNAREHQGEALEKSFNTPE